MNYFFGKIPNEYVMIRIVHFHKEPEIPRNFRFTTKFTFSQIDSNKLKQEFLQSRQTCYLSIISYQFCSNLERLLLLSFFFFSSFSFLRFSPHSSATQRLEVMKVLTIFLQAGHVRDNFANKSFKIS